MLTSERSNYILNRLQQKGILSLKEIVEELKISEATARRDIDRLEQMGQAIRVRGGVSSIIPTQSFSLDRERINSISKNMAIARMAASIIQDGECIFLDAGSTIAPIIDFIQDKQVKIVTHNLQIPPRLQSMTVELYLIGGNYSKFHFCTMGGYTEKIVEQFHFNRAFFGCSGIDLQHRLIYNDNIETVPVKEVAMRCADQSYLLADASKLGKAGFCRFASLDSFAGVITGCPSQNMVLPSNFTIAEE